MRRFLVFAVACWLSAGIAHAQDPQTPQSLLAEAVAKAQFCDYTTKWAPLNKDGLTTSKFKSSKKKVGMQSLSLSNLFKPGRYKIEEHAEHYQFEGRWLFSVVFSPLQKHLQPKPERGEDEEIIQAINNMKGLVLIDEQTVGIIAIVSDLVEGFNFWRPVFGVPMPGRMETMSVTMIQRHEGTTWLPETMELKASGRSRPGLVEVKRVYLTTFNCSARATQ